MDYDALTLPRHQDGRSCPASALTNDHHCKHHSWIPWIATSRIPVALAMGILEAVFNRPSNTLRHPCLGMTLSEYPLQSGLAPEGWGFPATVGLSFLPTPCGAADRPPPDGPLPLPLTKARGVLPLAAARASKGLMGTCRALGRRLGNVGVPGVPSRPADLVGG